MPLEGGCFGENHTGEGEVKKLEFSPLLVSSVVLLTKVHLGVRVALYLHCHKNK